MYFRLGRGFRLSRRVRFDVSVGRFSSLASSSSDSAMSPRSEYAELFEPLNLDWGSEVHLL